MSGQYILLSLTSNISKIFPGKGKVDTPKNTIAKPINPQKSINSFEANYGKRNYAKSTLHTYSVCVILAILDEKRYNNNGSLESRLFHPDALVTNVARGGYFRADTSIPSGIQIMLSQKLIET